MWCARGLRPLFLGIKQNEISHMNEVCKEAGRVTLKTVSNHDGDIDENID